MNKKSFQRKFMHPTRRKLATMVHTGEYDSDTTVGWTPKKVDHEVGDIWEDESHRFEKKEGYTVKTSKNTEVLQGIRDYLEKKSKCANPECKRTKKTPSDIKLIVKTGYCVDCLADIETKIKHAGIWTEYQEYRIWGSMLVEGKIRIEQMREAHDGMKQVYEYINEDGTLEAWTLPQSVDEAKAEMMELITNSEVEIKELEEKRNEVFEIIKEKGYEHVL